MLADLLKSLLGEKMGWKMLDFHLYGVCSPNFFEPVPEHAFPKDGRLQKEVAKSILQRMKIGYPTTCSNELSFLIYFDNGV